MTRRLRDHEESGVVRASITRLMCDARGDLDADARPECVLDPIDLQAELAHEHEEELPRSRVPMADLGGTDA